MTRLNYLPSNTIPYNQTLFRASPGYYKGNHAAEFKDFTLFTAFQPIYSFSHRRKVGMEALVRSIDKESNPVPPWKVFNSIEPNELLHLEKILTAIHVDNFNTLDMTNAWLFLNVNPGSLDDIDTYSQYLRELLERAHIPPHRVVIEVLETAFNDESHLELSIKTLKQLGCMIAIDDFGAGHSNFERVWRMEPDIVKFDRSMIHKAARDPSVQVMLKGIVEILHSKKCIVLAEGIETYEEAVTAMDANIDLGQGFLLCRPFHVSDPIPRLENMWVRLYESYETYTTRNKLSYIDEIQAYIEGFRDLIDEVDNNDNLRIESEELFEMPRTMRLYVLSEDGAQLSSNLEAKKRVGSIDKKMEPLYQATGANWKLRPYYRNAINHPGELQITPPYLSITDAELCITLSQTILMNGQLQILCCDLKWNH